MQKMYGNDIKSDRQIDHLTYQWQISCFTLLEFRSINHRNRKYNVNATAAEPTWIKNSAFQTELRFSRIFYFDHLRNWTQNLVNRNPQVEFERSVIKLGKFISYLFTTYLLKIIFFTLVCFKRNLSIFNVQTSWLGLS